MRITDQIKDLINLNKIKKSSSQGYIDIELIQQLTSDKAKIQCLDMVEDESQKIAIIQSMNYDMQEQCLSMLETDDSKLQVLFGLNDDVKEKYLNNLKNADSKLRILFRLNDETKAKYVGLFESDDQKAKVILDMKNDETKMQCLNMIGNNTQKVEIVLSMKNDAVKGACIDICESDDQKAEVILSMKNDESKAQWLNCITNDECRVKVVRRIASDEAKGQCLGLIENIAQRYDILKAMATDDVKGKYLDVLETDGEKAKIVADMSIDLKRIQYITNIPKDKQELVYEKLDYRNFFETYKQMNSEDKSLYRRHLKSEHIETIKNNLDLCIASEVENVDMEQAKKMLLEMGKTNDEVLIHIDFNILKSPYIETLGINKINQISCFDDVQDQILNMTPEEYKVFFSCLDHHMKYVEEEQWTDMCKLLLDNIGDYSSLISDLQGKDYDVEKLYYLMQNKNSFEIKTAEELENCDEIIKQKCDEYIQSDNLEKKQMAVLQKAFGQDRIEMLALIGEYEIDQIDAIENEDLKEYIKCIHNINNIGNRNPQLLNKIYDEIDEPERIHKLLIRSELKKEFCKQYNKDLFQIDADKDKGKIITIPSSDKDDEFKIILTSVGAFARQDGESNAKESWNRKKITSPHICTSYIRNDMIGTAPIPLFCYGFNKMDENSLVLSGYTDIHSTVQTFSSLGGMGVSYYLPDTQINNTSEYNEIDFFRTQNGEKKQPDYIIVLKKNGKVQNMEQAQQASKDWGEMPIVVIDVDETLRHERRKVQELQENYEESPSLENARKLYQRIRNNRVTETVQGINMSKVFENTEFSESTFCEGVNVEKELSDIVGKSQETSQQHITQKQESILHQTGEVQLGDYETAFENVSAMERKTEMSRIHRIAEKIKEVQQDFEAR